MKTIEGWQAGITCNGEPATLQQARHLCKMLGWSGSVDVEDEEMGLFLIPVPAAFGDEFANLTLSLVIGEEEYNIEIDTP